MLLGMLVTLLLLMALLAIPMTLAFRVTREHSLHTSLTFIWLFGLVKVKSKGGGKAGKKNTVRNKHKNKNSKKGRSSFARQLFLQPELRRHLLSFVARFFRAIKRDELKLSMRLGLEIPADTGVLWGYIGPVAGWLGSLRHMSVHVDPDFQQSIFEIDGNGKLRIIPLQLIYLLGALVLSPVVWKSVVRARATKASI